MDLAQGLQFGAEAVEAVLRSHATHEALAAVRVPALAFRCGQRLRPVARAITEQEFGQARVLEGEGAFAQRGRRRRADLREQALVAIADETAVQRSVDVAR